MTKDVMVLPELELTTAQEKINSGLIAFTDKKEQLENLVREFKGMTIASIEDKTGYKNVSDARKKLKAERVQITKDGKIMRDQLTVVSRNISAKEKELVDIISPVEDALQAEEDRIDAEKERIRLEEEARETARIQSRIDTLAGYGYELDFNDIKTLSDAAFDVMTREAKISFEREQAEKAEADRIKLEQEAKEKADREAELLRLQKEKEALEEQRKQQAEAQRKIDEQNEAIAAEKKIMEEERLAAERQKQKEVEEKLQAEQLEIARKEAAEKERLRVLEEQRLAEEKKKADAEKARITAEKKAARAPEKVKIQKYIDDLKAVPVPEVKTAEALNVMATISDMVQRLETYAVKQIATL